MTIQLPANRLELHLHRQQDEIFEPESVADAPLIRFVAYGTHQRVFGWVRLHADRLTDLLNAHEELLLVDVDLETFIDGVTGTVDEVRIRREELIAVQAVEPRGNAAARRPTETHPVCMQAGNYLIGGHLHVEPGIDPVISAWDRAPMIPLTDAWIEYWADDERQHQWVGTIVVNRDALDWLRVVDEADLTDGDLRPV